MATLSYLLNLPNELLLRISDDLGINDIYSLVRTNRHLSIILTPKLLKFACSNNYCVIALSFAVANGNEDMIRLILDKGPLLSFNEVPNTNIGPLAHPEDPPHETHMLSLEPLSKDYQEYMLKILLDQRATVTTLRFRPCKTAIALRVGIHPEDLGMAEVLLDKVAADAVPKYRDWYCWLRKPLRVESIIWLARRSGFIWGRDNWCYTSAGTTST